MTIAIDYDGTYTTDPDLWDAFISAGILRGHSFVCVTNRPWEPEEGLRRPYPAIPFVCAGDQYKANAARAAGYPVSVWIDDMPGTITPPVDLP